MQIAAALLTLLLLTATPARADWIVAALAGASHTNANTLSVGGPAPAILGNVEYRGEAFKSPIYYDVRFGCAPTSGFGIEGEWIHAKARATTGSDTLSKFDQTHGLNFVVGSLVYRRPVTDRVLVSARGGGGFTLPHVEGTLLGTHTESYQYGGLALHGGAGLEVRIAGGLTALADLRITRTAEELEVAGATVNGTFVTSHVDFGIGWRF